MRFFVPHGWLIPGLLNHLGWLSCCTQWPVPWWSGRWAIWQSLEQYLVDLISVIVSRSSGTTYKIAKHPPHIWPAGEFPHQPQDSSAVSFNIHWKIELMPFFHSSILFLAALLHGSPISQQTGTKRTKTQGSSILSQSFGRRAGCAEEVNIVAGLLQTMQRISLKGQCLTNIEL